MADNGPTQAELADTTDAANKTAHALDVLADSSNKSGDSLSNLGLIIFSILPNFCVSRSMNYGFYYYFLFINFKMY